MRFGTLKVKNLYKSGSYNTTGRELGSYKLDLVGVQEVVWNNVSTVSAGKRNENDQLGTRYLCTTE
jgi:hypothetical protein